MVLCDTNILIEFYKNNSRVIQTLQFIGQSHLAISDVSKAELYFGALNKHELLKIKRHLSSIKNIPISNKISELFIELMENYSLSHKLSIPDALIASTSLYYGMELYTLNTKDFKFIPHLRLFSSF